MKKYFTSLAAAALLSFSAASFAQFTITGSQPANSSFNQGTFNPSDSEGPSDLFGFKLDNAVFGTLYVTIDGTEAVSLSSQFVGKEAKMKNTFQFGSTNVTETNPVAVDYNPGTNLVDFRINSSGQFGLINFKPTLNNGSNQTLFVINDLGTSVLVMFNDKGSFDRDFDDVVARIDASSFGIPAVPEPSTYAMLLAGLGAIGFMANRRKTLVK